jgi:hypothetical protein
VEFIRNFGTNGKVTHYALWLHLRVDLPEVHTSTDTECDKFTLCPHTKAYSLQAHIMAIVI